MLIPRKKFVEMELAKRLGKRAAGEEVDEGELRRRKIEQDLYAIPDHLQVEEEDGGAANRIHPPGALGISDPCA